ncbi:COMPASS (complex proteins associated with Set1p) component [Peltigera leucophlebia]|nr:COMPASS (complex proteins associated with Set1p) component [Peltigera leucophlebia]
MTEQNTNSTPIGDSTVSPSPIEKAELQPSTPIPAAMATHLTPNINHSETEMAETVSPKLSPAPQLPSTTSTPAAHRTATPTRSTNGNVESTPMPMKAASHGAPARRYLNDKVTGILLEGMKRLAAEQPEDPLRVLGEFLLQKSKELEGS